MTPEQIARNKRRNEHIRLVVTFLNLIAVGIIGLGIFAPMFDDANPLFLHWSMAATDKLTFSEDFSLNNVISWQAVIGALGFHGSAHIAIGFMEPEE